MGRDSLHLQTQPQGCRGTMAYLSAWTFSRWQPLSLRVGGRKGTTPPLPYSAIQTHTSVIFGSPCTSPLPPHSPDPTPGEGSGQRPADQGPAASLRVQDLVKVMPSLVKSQGRRWQSGLSGARGRRGTYTHEAQVPLPPGPSASHTGRGALGRNG